MLESLTIYQNSINSHYLHGHESLSTIYPLTGTSFGTIKTLYIRENHCFLCYRNTICIVLFFSNWFEKKKWLVSQLFNSEGLLLNYEEFLCKFDFPVPHKEFSIVMDAIPKGAVMLLRDSVRSPSTLPISLNPFEIPVGKRCFLSHPSSRIRSFFQKKLVTTPYVLSYWKNVVDQINWRKVWTLSSKYIITNKVRDISFKLLHRFHPIKVFFE